MSPINTLTVNDGYQSNNNQFKTQRSTARVAKPKEMIKLVGSHKNLDEGKTSRREGQKRDQLREELKRMINERSKKKVI